MDRNAALGACVCLLIGLEAAYSCVLRLPDPALGLSHDISDFCDSYYNSQLESALHSSLQFPAVVSSDFASEKEYITWKPFVVTGLNGLRLMGPLSSDCDNEMRVLKFKLESTMPVTTSLQWGIGLDSPINITHQNLSITLEIPVDRYISSICKASIRVSAKPTVVSLQSSLITVVDQHGSVKNALWNFIAKRWARAAIVKSVVKDHILEMINGKRLII